MRNSEREKTFVENTAISIAEKFKNSKRKDKKSMIEKLQLRYKIYMQKNNDNVRTFKRSQSFYQKNKPLRYKDITKNENDYNDIM